MKWPQGAWSRPRTIYSFQDGAPHPGVNKVIANRLVVLSSGEWVLPFWRERGRSCIKVDPQQQGRAGVLISEDKGATWNPYGDISTPQTWLIEQTVVEVEPGHLMMFCRTAVDLIYLVTSDDYGHTWSGARPTSLPNPNAKIAAITLPAPTGSSFHAKPRVCILLCFNDHPVYPQPYVRSRTHLRLAVSCNSAYGDKEIKWERLLDLEPVKIQGYRHHYPTLLFIPNAYSNVTDPQPSVSHRHRVALVYSSFFMKQFKKSAPEGIRLIAVDIHLDTNAI
mmetsp:Transcript_2734/g.5421  ORF Transcript_2734/g.5421 Transcript_2734/m.5421 type:complete len:279 (-) Transcript_2734:50-886(-)